MRWPIVLVVAGCTPPAPPPVNVAGLREARFDAVVSERGVAAMFVFPDELGCPLLDSRMRATVDGEPVALASPQADADAYPRGTPCVGYQLDADRVGDIWIRDASGEAHVRIANAAFEACDGFAGCAFVSPAIAAPPPPPRPD